MEALAEAGQVLERHHAQQKAQARAQEEALQESLIKLSAAQAAVFAMQSKIAELQRYRLPPKGQSMKVLKCALYTLGYTRDDVRDSHTKKTDWAKLKMHFNNDFFTTLQAYDPTDTVWQEGKKMKSKKGGKIKKVHVIPKYRQTASLLALIDGIEVGEINNKSVAVGALLDWCKQVLEVRERAKVKLAKEKEIEEARLAREAEEEAARKAQEEEEAAAKAAEEAEAAAAAEAEAAAAAEESCGGWH